MIFCVLLVSGKRGSNSRPQFGKLMLYQLSYCRKWYAKVVVFLIFFVILKIIQKSTRFCQVTITFIQNSTLARKTSSIRQNFVHLQIKKQKRKQLL